MVVLLSKNRHDFFCLPPHHSLGDDVRQDDGLAVGLRRDFFGLYIGRLLHTHLTILHRRYSCLNLLGIYTKISNTTSVHLIVFFYQFFEILDYIPWFLVLKTLFFCILHLNAAFAISLNKVGVELAWRLDDLLTIFLGVIFTDAVTWCLLDVIQALSNRLECFFKTVLIYFSLAANWRIRVVLHQAIFALFNVI